MAAKKKATKKKATKKTAKKAAPKKKEVVLVLSKAKEALKAHDVNVAGDALESLNELVHNYIDQAAKRATANGRKTIEGAVGTRLECRPLFCYTIPERYVDGRLVSSCLES